VALEFPHEQIDVGAMREIAPGVHWLRMPLPFRLNHINLWLIEEDGGFALVDTGYADDPSRAIWERLFHERFADAPIRRVICTHYHSDHSGNAGLIAKRFGCELWMTQAEFNGVHAIRARNAGYASEQVIDMYLANGLSPAWARELKTSRESAVTRFPDFPDSFRRLLAGDLVTIGGRAWKVILGIGHSPEHAALYCEELKLVIAGDMLLPKISTNVSVQAIEPNGDPLALFLASLDRHAQMPADTLALPAHGMPFRGIRERVAQLHAHHHERLDKLLAACDAPKTAADILPVLFNVQLDAYSSASAMGEGLAHLHYLYYQGKLVRERGVDGVFRFKRA
jgi:glyoxylase-like metal-dependent hydrolase (beta-lactamase superfamily II)